MTYSKWYLELEIDVTIFGKINPLAKIKIAELLFMSREDAAVQS